MSIDLNNVKLTFAGDGQTKNFDVNIEGVGPHRDGYTPFALFAVKPEVGERTTLQYGMDYTYVANGENANAAHNLFYNSFTINLFNPLPAGVVLVVIRTTAVKSVSRYTMDKTPPRQVELDFDNVIKILQEQGYDIKELREALDAEIAERKEVDAALADSIAAEARERVKADAALAGAIKDEARERKEADDALGERIDSLVDFGNIQQQIMDAAEIIQNASGKLQGSVKTIYFISDGAATSYRIPGPMLGRDIPLMAFDVATRRRIWFAEKTETDGSVALELAVPLPAGTRFGVVYLRAADMEGSEGALDFLDNFVTKDDLAAAVKEVLEDNAAQPDLETVAETTPKVKMFTDTITGDGSAVEFTVAHSLGTKKIVVQTFDDSENAVVFGVKPISASTLKLTAAIAPAAGETFTVVIMGVTE